MADPVAVLAVASLLSGLAAHPACGVRGRWAHGVLCAAMVAMAVPGVAVLGPLAWAGLLGGVAYWAAGADRPVLARLPVLADLLAMAALVVLMPLAAAHPGAVPHQHGGHTAATTPSFLPVVVVVLWAAARCALHWHARGSPVPGPRRLATVTAEVTMAAGMLLMVG
ncbi:MAG TPA: DUF5134 domain-containing protein [Amycolatopsis sp.]|uniref:DUF5134 domain-containing protein n=1 Tax=Amycolatopsis sp. TaxID=37632 RepID=UPI002F42EDE9